LTPAENINLLIPLTPPPARVFLSSAPLLKLHGFLAPCRCFGIWLPEAVKALLHLLWGLR
jgi:hypothetical protein